MESLPLTIIEFILLFGLLVFLHELGHFLMARLFKIPIEEFGFGYPPRLVKLFTLGGTDFTLNWIPFGGFVRPRGENDPAVPGGMAAANPWKRFGVLIGGPLMNILTGIILFTIIFTMLGEDPTPRTVEIAEVVPNSPAQLAGIQRGDIIAAINGESITNQEMLRSIIQQHLDEEITVSVQRGSEQMDVTLTPRSNPPPNEGAMGIAMLTPRYSFFEALPYGVQVTTEQIKQLFLLPGQLIRGQVSSEEARIVGPKGMFDIYRQAREMDQETQSSTTPAQVPPALNTFSLLATISVALGITNLLPIPALDGGRILFLLPEIILRRRIPQEYENLVHLVGFVALIALMIYVTTQDIVNPIVLPR